MMRNSNLIQAAMVTVAAMFLMGCYNIEARSNQQIAEEAIECMMNNDPEAGLGILFVGGKDAYATMLEQTMTKDQLAAFRDENCNQPIRVQQPAAKVVKDIGGNVSQQTPQVIPPQSMPQYLPTIAPTPHLEATKNPLSGATNRFLEIRYDASKTINNRQLPANSLNCSGGSSPLTRWSKTLNIENQRALIQDAAGNTIQVKELHFKEFHPGRSYSEGGCPRDKYGASATVVNLSNNAPPNLTGYMAEWRDEKGNLIRSTPAHDGIAITLEQDQEPEDLFDGPASFLIYDQHTQGAQPTPTPIPTIRPEQKQVVFTVNPQEWESKYRGLQNHGRRYWTQTSRTSPDLSEYGYQIADINGHLWTVTGVSSSEKARNYPGPDTAEFHLSLTNDSRARANFTGYSIQINATNGGASGRGNWDPLENESPKATAKMVATTREIPNGPIQIRIWDTYEPALNPP